MSILLKDLFLYDPETRKLANEGVANVNDSAQSSHDLDVLRYELETFVCDGEYERGLQIILESFLGNIGQAEQPSAWVSGFFGSGKSHLVKMLRALWVNTRFPDGATAQGIASLPDRIKDLLTELKKQENGTEGCMPLQEHWSWSWQCPTFPVADRFSIGESSGTISDCTVRHVDA